MARVTVEDCLKNVDNRFELVFAATERARKITKEGIDPLVPWDNDKPTVVALREIAEGLLLREGENIAVSAEAEAKAEAEAGEENIPLETPPVMTAEEISAVDEELSS